MNISLEVKPIKNKNKSNYLTIITYFRGKTEEECIHYYECIKKNLENPMVNKIVCLAFPEEFSGQYLHTHQHLDLNLDSDSDSDSNSALNSKLIVHLLSDNDDEENYYNLFYYANQYCKNDFCAIIRTDIVINQNDFLTFLPSFWENNNIYVISSANKLGEKLWKEQDKMNNFYSLNHDLWLFKSNLNVDLEDLEDLKKYNFNTSQNEGYVNKILSKKYSLINDTENIQIFSIKQRENEEIDNLRIKGNNINSIDNDKLYLLPEMQILDKLTVDQLLKHFNIDELTIYKLKCRIFTKNI
jgi:hypothetical protein